jgi:hypothetical protein
MRDSADTFLHTEIMKMREISLTRKISDMPIISQKKSFYRLRELPRRLRDLVEFIWRQNKNF